MQSHIDINPIVLKSSAIDRTWQEMLKLTGNCVSESVRIIMYRIHCITLRMVKLISIKLLLAVKQVHLKMSSAKVVYSM